MIAFLIGIMLEVPVVVNGIKPTGMPKTLVFDEDLRFGGDTHQGDAYLWSGLYPKVTAAPDGRIFVADSGANRVLCFDEHGQFIRELYGEGRGPGEFQRLINFTVCLDGTAIALEALNDTGRFFYFDDAFEFIEEKKVTKGSVRLAHFSADGKQMWVHYIGPYAKSFDVKQGVMSLELAFEIELTKASMTPFDAKKMNDQNYLKTRFAEVIASQHRARGLAAFGLQGQLVTAISDRYQITQWLPDMTKTRLIEKRFEPKYRNASKVDEMIDDYVARFKADIPPIADRVTRHLIEQSFELSAITPLLDPLAGLLITADGTIIAVRETESDGTQIADLFSSDGQYIGIQKMPHLGFVGADSIPNMVFRGESAYTMELVDGDFQVVRYRYKLQ